MATIAERGANAGTAQRARDGRRPYPANRHRVCIGTRSCVRRLTILVPIGAAFGHGTRTHTLSRTLAGREASKCAVRPQSQRDGRHLGPKAGATISRELHPTGSSLEGARRALRSQGSRKARARLALRPQGSRKARARLPQGSRRARASALARALREPCGSPARNAERSCTRRVCTGCRQWPHRASLACSTRVTSKLGEAVRR